MTFASNLLLYTLLWYMWVVRMKHLKQVREELNNPFLYNQYLDKEHYWLMLVIAFAVTFSAGVGITNIYTTLQLVSKAGLPYGF